MKILTASHVAKFCQCDLKTVHNWVNRGKLVGFRTPGRHLRFRPQDVVHFLEKHGFPVPPELRQNEEVERARFTLREAVIDLLVAVDDSHWTEFAPREVHSKLEKLREIIRQ